MLDPSELYDLAGELPELDAPVLVVAMTGFVEARMMLRSFVCANAAILIAAPIGS